MFLAGDPSRCSPFATVIGHCRALILRGKARAVTRLHRATALELKYVSNSFGSGDLTLKEVSASIEPKELAAPIGAAGSGKATLIRRGAVRSVRSREKSNGSAAACLPTHVESLK